MRKLKALLIGVLAAGALVAAPADAHVSSSNMSTQFTYYNYDNAGGGGDVELTAKGTLSNPGDSHAKVILDIDVAARDGETGPWPELYPHGHKVIPNAGGTVSISLDVGFICNGSGPLSGNDYIRIKFRARTYNASNVLTGDQTINQSQRQTCDVVGPYQ